MVRRGGRPDWMDRTIGKLESYDAVRHVEQTGGENDYIAGQRDVDYVHFDVYLEHDVVGRIDNEAGKRRESDTLRGVRQRLEHEGGFVLGDDWTTADHVDHGAIQITMRHDNRPRGSDVGRRFPRRR